MRSANEPTISAQVMPAKVAWKAMKMYSGIFTSAVKVSASDRRRDALQEQLVEARR